MACVGNLGDVLELVEGGLRDGPFIAKEFTEQMASQLEHWCAVIHTQVSIEKARLGVNSRA